MSTSAKRLVTHIPAEAAERLKTAVEARSLRCGFSIPAGVVLSDLIETYILPDGTFRPEEEARELYHQRCEEDGE